MASRFLSVVLLLVAFSCTSFALKQEVWLHLEGGNALYFDQNTPDLTEYAPLLKKVNKICSLGRWYGFINTNYINATGTIGDASKSDLRCFTVQGYNIKSIRHLSNSDTDVDSISVYEGTYFEGQETQALGRAYTGITHKVESLAATGHTDWMLFTGKYLDGASVCYKVPYPGPGYYMNYHVTMSVVGVPTVGSVFRGCDLDAIKAYRNMYLHVLITT